VHLLLFPAYLTPSLQFLATECLASGRLAIWREEAAHRGVA